VRLCALGQIMWRNPSLLLSNITFAINISLASVSPPSPAMTVEVALNTPLAKALGSVIQPKLVEVGWSSGGVDDSALSEYIILMLVNGKTQEQIAAELSGDLLNLGPDDPGAVDFSRWLFEQVDVLHNQINGGSISEPIVGGSDQVGQQGPAHQERDGSGLAHDTTERGQDSLMNDSMDTVMQSNVYVLRVLILNELKRSYELELTQVKLAQLVQNRCETIATAIVIVD
jgi:hypothetical protein